MHKTILPNFQLRFLESYIYQEIFEIFETAQKSTIITNQPFCNLGEFQGI